MLRPGGSRQIAASPRDVRIARAIRSEEHTSELQSHLNLVCRLLLEKKKTPPQQAIVLLSPPPCKYSPFSAENAARTSQKTVPAIIHYCSARFPTNAAPTAPANTDSS